MSVYEKFTTTSAALAMFALGKCRRHVEVGGHVIDLVQAASPCVPSRPEDDRAPMVPSHGDRPLTREEHDQIVALCVPAALTSVAVMAKPAPVCPYCLRPEGPT